MLKRPHYIALVVVALLALLLLKLPGRAVERLRLAISSLFVPLAGLRSSAQQAARKTGDALIPRRDLQDQRDRFRLENEQLRIQLLQRDEAVRENAQLRSLLAWQRQSPWKLKLARVIGRDPSNWWRTLQIDAGERDGIRENFPVLTAQGLVGRIARAGPTRAQVVLLGDPNLRVGAVIQETRETGVILASADNPLDTTVVEMGYLSRNSAIKSGQTVVTSGDGAIFPRGMIIGHVIDHRSINYGLAVEARVKLTADFNTLEEVWVMIQ